MFRHESQVRFSDTDAMGHVNHSRFLAYIEDARVALLGASGVLSIGGEGIILARIEVDYRRPVMLSPEPVVVQVWVIDIGVKSFRLGYRVDHGGEHVADAVTVQVAFDYSAQRSRILRDDERAALEAWKPAAPVG